MCFSASVNQRSTIHTASSFSFTSISISDVSKRPFITASKHSFPLALVKSSSTCTFSGSLNFHPLGSSSSVSQNLPNCENGQITLTMTDDFDMFRHMIKVAVDQSPEIPNEKRYEANEYLRRMTVHEFGKSLEYSTIIFQDPKSQPTEIQLSAMVMYRTLMPQTNVGVYQMHIGQIREKWFEESFGTIRESVKKCVLIGIGHENPRIRSVSASAIAVVMLIESETWASDLERLTKNVLDPSVNMCLKLGSLVAIVEVFGLPIVTPEHLKKYTGMKASMIDVLGVAKDLIGPGYAEELRRDAAKCVLNMLKAIPDIFDNDEILGVLVSVIGKSLQTAEPNRTPLILELSKVLHMILFEFVHQFYPKLNQGIFQSMKGVIEENINATDEDRVVCGLGFWRDVIQLELEKGAIAPDSVRGFARDSPELPEMLCRFLGVVQSEEDIDVEEISGDELPHIRAQESLRMLHTLNPDGVLASVRSYFGANIGAQEWPKVHGAILSLSCVCSVPSTKDGYQFVAAAMPCVANIAGSNDSIPRLRETALWAVGCCIKHYTELLQAGGQIENLIGLINSAINGPPAVVKRCFNIVYYICVNCPDTTLDTYFSDFMECIMGKITMNLPPDCVKSLYYALDALITHTSRATDEALLGLLAGLVEQVQNPALSFEAKAGVCSSLRAIAVRFKTELPEPGIIMQAIIVALSHKNCDIWEEGLRTISTILWCGAQRVQSSAARIFELVGDGLKSCNVPITHAAFCTLGDLFGTAAPEMRDRLGDAIECIDEFMKNNQYILNQVFPEIIKALAMILHGAGQSMTEDQRDQVLKWINEASRVEADRFDRQYALTLYQGLLRAYSNMFLVFSNDTRFLLNQVSRPAFDLVQKIGECNLDSDEILHELYYLFHTTGTTLKQKINVKLNKPIVKMLINRGIECTQNPTLQQEASHLQKLIKSL